MLTPLRHVELAQYMDDTVFVATSNSPSLPVNYLNDYFCMLENWLRD